MFLTHLAGALAACALCSFIVSPAPAHAQDTTDAQRVSVTVKYAGAGSVDATHRLWVWLFDTPNIGSGSIPLHEASLDKNGGTATFNAVTAKQVYVAVAFDEGGGFQGQAPPPSGSPIALYGVTSAEAKPTPVSPGAKGMITVAFDDAQRMP